MTVLDMPRAIAAPYAMRNAKVIHSLVAVGWSAQAQRVASDLQRIPITSVPPSTIAALADHVARVATGARSGARFVLARAKFLGLVEAASREGGGA